MKNKMFPSCLNCLYKCNVNVMAITVISRILELADKFVAVVGSSTINGEISSCFLTPEYLMRGCVVFGTVNSNWYDGLLFELTLTFDGVVKMVDVDAFDDADEFGIVVKILDCDTDAFLMLSIAAATILLAEKLAFPAKPPPVITKL